MSRFDATDDKREMLDDLAQAEQAVLAREDTRSLCRCRFDAECCPIHDPQGARD